LFSLSKIYLLFFNQHKLKIPSDFYFNIISLEIMPKENTKISQSTSKTQSLKLMMRSSPPFPPKFKPDPQKEVGSGHTSPNPLMVVR
jgi:catechol-2,3-dioxygenase